MRRVCVILAVLLAASAAGAATRKPVAAANGLRGQQTVAPAAATAPDPLAPIAGLPADPAQSQASSQTAAFAPDDGQCRSQCRKTYFFCLSGEAADSCPERWTACENQCSRTARNEASTPN